MIGIDYGVRRVAVAYLGGASWAEALVVKESDRGSELVEMQEWVLNAVGGLKGDIFIESAIGGMSGNIQTVVGMAETCGALMACFPGRAHKVAPSSWKALVCGSGRLDKAGVAAWLEREHPALAEACRKPNGKLDQDRVDATCLGLCTVDGLAERRTVPRRRARPVLRAGPSPADVASRGRGG